MRLPTHLPLFWTICLINGVVFVVAALLLVLTPARVSTDPVAAEVAVVTVGLAVMLLANALLIGWALAPLQRLITRLEDIEHLEPTHLPEEGWGPVREMARGLNGLLRRLADERRAGDVRALAAQESERHRIAQELHDEVGQSLTVVLLGLKQVEGRAPAELVPELAGLRESARAGLDDVRRVARRLRPGVLDDLGLTSALATLTTDFEAHSAASVRRSFTPGLPPLSPEVEVVIYRVAQEALTNAARHADAREVELSLQRLGDRVVLEVRDDGRGFDMDSEGSQVTGSQVTGSGLMGMRERAALVGAELSVTSRPLRGTTVSLSIPVDGAVGTA